MTTTDAAQIFIGRQPIFDVKDAVMGYELLFRNGSGNFCPQIDSDLASRTSMERALMGFGLESLTGNRLAFVNLSREVLLDGSYDLLPAGRVVLEILETIDPDDQVLEACRAAKAKGYRLALDDFTYREDLDPLLALADIVKVDLRAEPAARERATAAAKDRGAILLAEKVETHAERARAEELGFSYFQGYFYSRPEVIEGRPLNPSMLGYLRLLSEVGAPDVSFERIEGLIRQEMALSVRLLRYLNSAGFGWRYEVKTIEQAVRLFGLEPLRKWVALLAVTAMADDKPTELVVTGLIRARLAESLGPVTGLSDRDLELFLTGLLSVLDAVMDRPLPELLKSLPVSNEVKTALLERHPPLGPVLDLVLAQETAAWQLLDERSQQLGLESGRVPALYTGAISWATSVLADF
ncbi:MAG: EAL and HDOD domain-containing protein [Gemmatimonadales bacterium]